MNFLRELRQQIEDSSGKTISRAINREQLRHNSDLANKKYRNYSHAYPQSIDGGGFGM